MAAVRSKKNKKLNYQSNDTVLGASKEAINLATSEVYVEYLDAMF